MCRLMTRQRPPSAQLAGEHREVGTAMTKNVAAECSSRRPTIHHRCLVGAVDPAVLPCPDGCAQKALQTTVQTDAEHHSSGGSAQWVLPPRARLRTIMIDRQTAALRISSRSEPSMCSPAWASDRQLEARFASCLGKIKIYIECD